jgi:hypothetical protein
VRGDPVDVVDVLSSPPFGLMPLADALATVFIEPFIVMLVGMPL